MVYSCCLPLLSRLAREPRFGVLVACTLADMITGHHTPAWHGSAAATGSTSASASGGRGVAVGGGGVVGGVVGGRAAGARPLAGPVRARALALLDDVLVATLGTQSK